MHGRSTDAAAGGSASILASPFARRLLVLFILSALLPTLLLGILTARHLQQELAELHERHAQHLVKAAGLNLFDWMLRRDEEIKGVMQALREGRFTDTRELPALSITIDPAGTGASPASADAVAADALASRFERSADKAGTRFRFSRVFELPDGAWRVTSTATQMPSAHTVLPPSIDYCYLDATGAALQCSASLPAAVSTGLAAFTGAGYRSFTVSDAERTLHVRSWQIFLGAEFGLPDWKIVVWHEDADLLLSVSAFGDMLRPTVLAGSLIAVLFAAIAIRRHLHPFRVLTDAARRIGPGHLDVNVELATGDELEDLGHAFNDMALRLKRNFELQSALGAIDRQALGASDPASTVAALLRGLGALLHLDWACVWFHDGRADQMLLTLQDAPGAEPSLRRMAALSGDERAQLLNPDGWHEVPIDLAVARTAAGRVIETVYAVPLALGDQAAAAVWVAPPRGGAFTAEDEAILRELAARLAVALAHFKAKEDLFQEAYFDTLTNLPNRRMFLQMLESALPRAARETRAVGVLFVDLDDFKYVNDSLGHTTGDKLLKAVAGRLRRTARDVDLVARLGGDEFVVILPDLPGDAATASAHLERVAEKVLDALRMPVMVDGHELLARASIGGALSPRDGTDAESLLRAADAAMYATKDGSRGGFSCYTPGLAARATRAVELQAELARAIERDEFILHYQPQISAAGGTVVGCEALIRWQHPTRGLLGPGEFLAEAEASGLIGEIGSNTLRRAARQLAAWHAQGFGELSMSVNVSARQFEDPHLVNLVANIIEDVGIPASLLELEITESVACRRLDRTVEIMSQLTALGVRLAIDDFGTGHSSLSYLQRMPLHTLKVDRSFVIEIGVSRRGESIIDAILALGKCLSLDIVAEGVETQAQFDYLATRGCDTIQGWLYRPALAPIKFIEYVSERRAIVHDGAARASLRRAEEPVA